MQYVTVAQNPPTAAQDSPTAAQDSVQADKQTGMCYMLCNYVCCHNHAITHWFVHMLVCIHFIV